MAYIPFLFLPHFWHTVRVHIGSVSLNYTPITSTSPQKEILFQFLPSFLFFQWRAHRKGGGAAWRSLNFPQNKVYNILLHFSSQLPFTAILESMTLTFSFYSPGGGACPRIHPVFGNSTQPSSRCLPRFFFYSQ